MSDPFKFLGKAFEEARKSLAYRVEAVSLDYTEELVQRMEELGMKRVELARKLNVSAPYVSKLLDGAGNFTLETLVKAADAVHCDLSTHLTPRHCESMWIDVLKEEICAPSLISTDELPLVA
jgi:transcriptional regulator with XRE-family HTH domain